MAPLSMTDWRVFSMTPFSMADMTACSIAPDSIAELEIFDDYSDISKVNNLMFINYYISGSYSC